MAAETAKASSDPRASADGQVKLAATLDGSPAWWLYSGVIYAVRPKTHPVAILAISGCEAHWAHRRADGSYIMTGALVSLFRDVETGAFLDVFENPFTGKRNSVAPNLLSGGGAVFPADGSSAHAFGRITDAVIAPRGFAASDPEKPLGGVRWSTYGSSIMLMTDRSWNVAEQPQLEAQTQSADRTDFFDPRLRKIPARYTATTIIPWLTWMEMPDVPGHLVWHSSGEKAFSLDALPEDYRTRAGALVERLAHQPEL
jgi:hypothetical protein